MKKLGMFVAVAALVVMSALPARANQPYQDDAGGGGLYDMYEGAYTFPNGPLTFGYLGFYFPAFEAWMWVVPDAEKYQNP